MDKIITRDGWQKSTRSGGQEGACVESKAVTWEEAKSLGIK